MTGDVCVARASVRVLFDERGGWRVDGLGTDDAGRRFATRQDAERFALEHRARDRPEAGEFLVLDAYHRVVHPQRGGGAARLS